MKKNDLPSGWRVVELGDVIKINPTESLKKGVLAKKIPMNALGEFKREINFYELTKFNGGTKFKNGDTLLARITPCLENGKTSYVDILQDNEIGFGSTEYIVLRETPNISDKQFIYYFSISPLLRTVAIQSMTGTTGRQRVQTDIIKNFHFNLPSLSEQKAIAHILGKLDDKIALNRQINQTLESMAQTLFKSWFVNFDPVIDNALEAGNPIPDSLKTQATKRKTTKSTLPQATQNLFPNRFVFNNKLKKWIPEGWEVKNLGEVGKVVCGKTPSKSKKEYYGGNTLFVKIPNMHNEVYVLETNEYLTELGSKSQLNKSIPRGGIAVSCIATVGKVVLIDKESHTNQQINSIIPNQGYYQYYLYFLMLSLNGHFHSLASSGSATLNMNTSTFSDIEITMPNNRILKTYDKQVKSNFETILFNQKQTQTLTKLRDTLLPKLISGKIQVKIK